MSGEENKNNPEIPLPLAIAGVIVTLVALDKAFILNEQIQHAVDAGATVDPLLWNQFYKSVAVAAAGVIVPVAAAYLLPKPK